jgi:hypothetical protein
MDHKKNAMGVKRRIAILSMAACVALSGVITMSGGGVRMGLEKVNDAKQAKKQAEDVQKDLDKKLDQGQED